MLPRRAPLVKHDFWVLYIFSIRRPYYVLQQNFGKEACTMKGNNQNNNQNNQQNNNQNNNQNQQNQSK